VNYAAIGIHQTSDTHLSMFLTGGRRYTLRLDGFVSVNAPLTGGDLITKLRHQRRRPDTHRTARRHRQTAPRLHARRLRTNLG
jgi:hypothetical protein